MMTNIGLPSTELASGSIAYVLSKSTTGEAFFVHFGFAVSTLIICGACGHATHVCRLTKDEIVEYMFSHWRSMAVAEVAHPAEKRLDRGAILAELEPVFDLLLPSKRVQSKPLNILLDVERMQRFIPIPHGGTNPRLVAVCSACSAVNPDIGKPCCSAQKLIRITAKVQEQSLPLYFADEGQLMLVYGKAAVEKVSRSSLFPSGSNNGYRQPSSDLAALENSPETHVTSAEGSTNGTDDNGPYFDDSAAFDDGNAYDNGSAYDDGNDTYDDDATMRRSSEQAEANVKPSAASQDMQNSPVTADVHALFNFEFSFKCDVPLPTSIDESGKKRIRVEAQIKRAMQGENIPISSLSSGSTNEGVFRLSHPDLGQIEIKTTVVSTPDSREAAPRNILSKAMQLNERKRSSSDLSTSSQDTWVNG